MSVTLVRLRLRADLTVAGGDFGIVDAHQTANPMSRSVWGRARHYPRMLPIPLEAPLQGGKPWWLPG